MKGIRERVLSRVTIGSEAACCEPDGSLDESFSLCKKCQKDYVAITDFDKLKAEAIKVATEFRSLYSTLQERSKPGEKDALYRAFAADTIIDAIRRLSESQGEKQK